MPNQNRIRRNGATKAAPVQTKTSRRQPVPATHAPMYALSLIEYSGLREMRCSEIDIPADVFEAIQKKVNAADDATFTALLTQGLAAMTKPADDCELENAHAANNALMQLLWEHIEFTRLDSGGSNFTDGGESATLCFGIFQLVNSCRERLNQAAEVAS